MNIQESVAIPLIGEDSFLRCSKRQRDIVKNIVAIPSIG